MPRSPIHIRTLMTEAVRQRAELLISAFYLKHPSMSLCFKDTLTHRWHSDFGFCMLPEDTSLVDDLQKKRNRSATTFRPQIHSIKLDYRGPLRPSLLGILSSNSPILISCNSCHLTASSLFSDVVRKKNR